MRQENLKTRIFIDGGDPAETKESIGLLGFLDGQTTNPTLISKNPGVRGHLEHGGKYTEKEVYEFYREVVRNISAMIPQGSVSVEVYADTSTKAEAMLKQAVEMFSWIPNAHIKFPTSTEGLKAAEQAIKVGMRVNLTLCFSQAQAAAVYAATRGAKKGDVFVSPFIGRIDDRGENGMDLISNVLKMYRGGDGHVEVLTASVRSIDHLLYALSLGSDIITAPFEILKEWAGRGLPIPGKEYVYGKKGLKEIPYEQIDLGKDWRAFDISHELTVKGMEKFSHDWNALIR
ncbi:MAG TPA: transaldolase family protein [Candidatus Sulfobium mesophilum]|nr:transaldolase family protein [Candidatus Sulfobium mesophilum]